MTEVQYSKSLSVYAKTDVLIVGGGVAGCAAALALARKGRKPLLIEKSNILGGLATLGLVNYFEPLCNGCGRQVMRGMTDEFFKLCIKYGYDDVPPVWKDGIFHGGSGKRYHTFFSPMIFALALTEALHNEGASILFDTLVTDVIRDGEKLSGVVISNKSGTSFIQAKQIIDTTGDGDILTYAGVPTADGVNYFTMEGRLITLEGCKKAAEAGDIRLAFGRICGGTGNQFGVGHPEGMPTFDGISGESVTDFIEKNQLEMLEKLKKTPRMEREVAYMPLMPQFRKTRCIKGEYTMNEGDLFVHHADSVGVMNDNLQKVNLYEIPFSCLVNRCVPNLITAGRSASAEGRLWDILRIIPSCIVTGQAAGIAAEQALSGDRAIYEPDIAALQADMAASGGLVHFEDEWKNDIPASPATPVIR